ncbi:DEAD/DEAH box helicase [Methanoculleus chikugoensis]|uniref:DEAD/DEAH box helicase n=1 Tax=Methanoculleus chikugoensis TaxID=118126 RepID=UPI001FB32D8D|nr:DEAD/DEAH box helicase [Methanoculleus chikugoensis]
MLVHLEKLLAQVRDLDRVLASVGPERPPDRKRTLFDRLEAHEVQKTAHITELPLPPAFSKAAGGVEYLMPVQQLAVQNGLLEGGQHLLVVSATASGKTFIGGEMAGMKNFLEGKGRMLFLVPLVALANQKYQRFRDRYGHLVRVTLQTGGEPSQPPPRDPARRGSGRQRPPYGGRNLRGDRSRSPDGATLEGHRNRRHRRGADARGPGARPPSRRADRPAQAHCSRGAVPLPLGHDRCSRAACGETPGKPCPLRGPAGPARAPPHLRRAGEEDQLHQADGRRGVQDTVVEGLPRSDDRLHELPRPLPRHRRRLGRKAAPYHAGLSAQERRDVERWFANGRSLLS